MYLLDTNVVSELRRARPHGAVVAWLEGAREEDLHLSAVTIGEIQAREQAVELVALMVASALYAACQAVDLRVMHATFLQGLSQIVAEASAGILPKDVETGVFDATVQQ